jgi:nondiscriminating aspartyl-tRNA synthetase
MKRIYTNDIKNHVGEIVTVAGFIHSIRDQGNIKFLIIRDVKGLLQGVVLKDSQAFPLIKDLTLESVVKIDGLAKDEKQAPGGYEIEVQTLEVLSKADHELPIPVVIEKGGNEPDLPTRLDWRWLDLRREEHLNIFKVWTSFEKGVREYFLNNDYIQFNSPSFMQSASESGSEVFEVKYFERNAYLAQSPQYYKQMAMASGFEKVFCMGPVFRAEPSYTTRHMTEYTGWDFEISYIDSHHDVMDEEEKMLITGFKTINKELNLGLEIPVSPFPRISMKDAKSKLKAKNIPSDKEHDLSPDEEKEICSIIKEETGSDFVFLTDWDISIRPFYHMRHKDDPSLTKSFDLLYKGLEITTGAQREHRPDILAAQAKEKGMELPQLKDYLNFFKYGCPPHGGVGIGPGRIVMKMLDLPNVKEAAFLPRDVKRLNP